jgi:WD40 repeat protein
LRGHEGDIGSLQFSTDSHQLLSASWDSNSIWLWDLSVLPPAFTALPVPDGFEPWTALFSPDGSTIVTNSLSGAYAWDLAHLAAAPRLLQPLNNWGTELAVSPNSAFLAIASRNKDIYLKDFMHPGQPAAVLRGHSGRGAWSVAFSPDGKRLASGGDTDATVRLWNPAIPDAPSIVLGRHDEAVTRVRFSPNGKQLASVSLDYGVRLWQPDQPDALPIVLSGHEGEIWALAYSPDGRYLVTGGRDKTIRIWDLTHPLNSATTKEIADMVCTKVWRNLTLEEWQKFIGEDIPYERTCPNLPIDPGLFETAEKLARAGDKAAALALLERALELDPDLDLKPQEQVESWLQSTER